MDRCSDELMNTLRRLLLAVTLTLLLFGLAAHSLPTSSLCGCVSVPQEGSGASNPDLCLICQLQTGIYTSPRPASPNRENTFHASEQRPLNALECVFSVLHHPIAS